MNLGNAPNILIPTDFSEHSGHALRYAASLGERFGATLHMLHVLTLHGLEGALEADQLPNLDPLLDAADRAARTQLDAGALHGGEAEAKVVKAVVRGVNAWDEILDYARQKSIDLIVMAKHSGSGLSSFLLGSVTERVLRFAPCPVLVVKKGDRDFVDPATMGVRLEKVVVADDLTEKIPAALKYAVDWLDPYRPEIHLAHAIEIEVPVPYIQAGVTSVFQLDPELRGRLLAIQRDRDCDLIPEGWTVVTEHCEGKPFRVVPEYAAKIKADLMVVAGETRIDLGERILGGTVERIARHTPCPMLVV